MAHEFGESETRLEWLFEQAAEISDPEALEAFLEKNCGDDPSLKTELVRLLQAHRQAGQFLSGKQGFSKEKIDRDDAGFEDVEDTSERITGYKLMGLIGEGGFSRVYLAEQEMPVRRCVALKIIKAGMDTHEVILRFERERQVLALMDHPGIARVFDAGATTNGRPFFAMELVRGMAITRYCDEHRLSILERLNLFCQVCRAVMYAHQKGVIHRDLKPSNILVSEHDGRPCPTIVDFGLAKLTKDPDNDVTPVTWGKSFMGTPAYMSPEQAQLGNLDVDTRSDIYSLGALLYELLSGQPPFENRKLLEATWENMACLIHQQDPLRPSIRLRRLAIEDLPTIAAARQSTPHALCRLLEGDLDWIVLKALEKERAMRYQSAAEFAEDLDNHLENRPVSAAAPSIGYRLHKLVRRNRNAVAIAGIILSLLLASVVISSRLAINARFNADMAKNSQAAAELAEGEARHRLIEVNVAAGLAANEKGDHDEALLWFAHAALAAEREPDGRAVNHLRSRAWLSANAFPVWAFQATSHLKALQFAPSLESHHLAALAVSHEFILWDAAIGSQHHWTRDVGPVEAFAWSPDGFHISLALVNGDVVIRRFPGGEIVECLPQVDPATTLAFSPDSRFLAIGARQLRLWDQQEHYYAVEWEHPAPVCNIVFSAESDRLATASVDGRARVFNVSSEEGNFDSVGSPLTHLPWIRVDQCDNKTTYHEDFTSEAYPSNLAFMEGGNLLATRSGFYEITFWEVDTAEVIRRFDHICCSCNVRFSSNCDRMATGMHGSVVGVWDTRSANPRAAMLPQGDCVYDVAFSPDAGMLLAAGADHNAAFWALDTNERVGSPLRHFNDVMSVEFSTDGQLVATSQADGLIRVWSVPRKGHPGLTLDYAPGPKKVRLGHEDRLVVATQDPAWNAKFHKTKVYDVASGSPVGPVLEFPGPIQDAAVSPDGRIIAVATHHPDSESLDTLQFIDVATGERVLGFSELPSPAREVCWHPQQALVAFQCREGETGLARLNGKLEINWLRKNGMKFMQSGFGIKFTPDGNRVIALGPNGSIAIWHLSQNPPPLTEIHGKGETFWSFVLSGSGQFLATTTVSGNVMVWDAESGQAVSPSIIHPGWVYRASFSPDEALLATACHDGRARIWNWRKSMLHSPPLPHPEQVRDAVFTPDGRWMLTACRDGSVRVWDCQSGGIVMPAIKVGEQALNIEIPKTGQQAVIGSLGEDIHVISLEILNEEKGWPLEDLLAMGELLSGSEIREGQRRKLTTAEWLERFHQFKQTSSTRFLPGLQEKHPSPLPSVQKTVVPCTNSGNCLNCPDIRQPNAPDSADPLHKG